MQAPTQTPKPNQLLTTTEAAALLGLSPLTLQDWRSRNRGPRYVRLSRRAIRYRPSDIEDFIEKNGTPQNGAANKNKVAATAAKGEVE